MSRKRVRVKGAMRSGRNIIADWQRPGYKSDYVKPEPDVVDEWIALAEAEKARKS